MPTIRIMNSSPINLRHSVPVQLTLEWNKLRIYELLDSLSLSILVPDSFSSFLLSFH